MKSYKHIELWIFPAIIVTILFSTSFVFDKIEISGEKYLFSGKSDTAYKLSMELLNLPGCVTDHHGTIIVWPLQSEKLLGWKEDEVIGKNINTLVSMQQIFNKPIYEIKNTDIPDLGISSNKKMEILRKDGTNLPIDICVKLDSNREKEVIALITFTNIKK